MGGITGKEEKGEKRICFCFSFEGKKGKGVASLRKFECGAVFPFGVKEEAFLVQNFKATSILPPRERERRRESIHVTSPGGGRGRRHVFKRKQKPDDHPLLLFRESKVGQGKKNKKKLGREKNRKDSATLLEKNKPDIFFLFVRRYCRFRIESSTLKKKLTSYTTKLRQSHVTGKQWHSAHVLFLFFSVVNHS